MKGTLDDDVTEGRFTSLSYTFNMLHIIHRLARPVLVLEAAM